MSRNEQVMIDRIMRTISDNHSVSVENLSYDFLLFLPNISEIGNVTGHYNNA